MHFMAIKMSRSGVSIRLGLADGRAGELDGRFSEQAGVRPLCHGGHASTGWVHKSSRYRHRLLPPPPPPSPLNPDWLDPNLTT